MTDSIVTLSETDSVRFGLRIARARIDSEAGGHAAELALKTQDIDLLILRVPAGAHQIPRALMESGLQVVHADTLVYYGASLSAWIDSPDYEGEACFSLATQEDGDAIRAVAKASFSGYRSHYQATPSLDQRLVSDGYAEWAASYASLSGDDRLTYVVKSDNAIVGFVAASLDAALGICDVVLNAVMSEYEGRGLYRETLGRVMKHAHRLGYTQGTISTQIWNYRVQRVWTRCGMHLTHAYDTYHVSRPATSICPEARSRTAP